MKRGEKPRVKFTGPTPETRLEIVQTALRWCQNILVEVNGNHVAVLDKESQEAMRTAVNAVQEAAHKVRLRALRSEPPKGEPTIAETGGLDLRPRPEPSARPRKRVIGRKVVTEGESADAGWGPWAEDEYHLLTAYDWDRVSKTRRYQGSEAKASALLKLRSEREGNR